MNTTFSNITRYLPQNLRTNAQRADWTHALELRLRCGRAMSMLMPDGERSLGGEAVTAQDLDHLVLAASRGSIYAVQDSLAQGYITLEGGHRLGLCGSAVMENGRVKSLTRLSGASLRLARQVPGAADQAMALLPRPISSTLIVGPPGCGKTTLLRDLIRQLSDREGLEISLVDERGEVAACRLGQPELEVGSRTDVLSGCPKAQGMLMMLRAMNPRVIAVDEVTDPRDIEAIRVCAGCGAAIIATAHGSSRHEMARRGLYRELFDLGVFQNLLFIHPQTRNVTLERMDTPC